MKHDVLFIASFTIHICLSSDILCLHDDTDVIFPTSHMSKSHIKIFSSNTMGAKHSTLWVQGDVWRVFNVLWCSITIQQIYFYAAFFIESMENCFAVSHLTAKELKVCSDI